jgi:hypothetical protein
MKGAGKGSAGFTQGPVPLMLRNARGQVLWQQDVPYLYPGEALLSPTGRYVATVKGAGSVTLYGPKGKQAGPWDILSALTKAEQKRITRSSCGPMVLGGASFKGEVLELEALTGGVSRPTAKQPSGTSFRLDPRAGRLTREIPRNAPKLTELIQHWRSTPAGSERDDVLNELSVRAAAANKPGALPELRSLWQELLTSPGLQLEERAAAVSGLQFIGTDEEVRTLAALPDVELGEPVLETLDARLPREAEAYALRHLESPSLSEELRKTAASFLIGRKGVVAEKGLALALRDPSALVRESALVELAKRPPTAAAFEQVLPLCQDPELKARQRAVEHQLHMLETRGPERKALLAALKRADANGKLEPFPEGWIILGGLAEIAGKHPQALELYARGVQGLSSAPSAETRSAGTRELLFEALLQLALEAKKRGQRDELVQRVHDVLAIPNSRETYIYAPKPNRYASGEAPLASKRFDETRSAMWVAKELIPRPEGHKH